MIIDKINQPVIEGVMIIEMYELLRAIGGNYKMSDFEFTSKVKYYKKLHEECGDDCKHTDLFLKKMLV